jgi:hypothetical protein
MSRAVVVVVAGVAGTLLSDALVAASLADQVVVRTYNEFRVAPRELATAIVATRAILTGFAL